MIAYQFIEALFKNILTGSAKIKGRFYLCPKGGGEINTDQMDQVIKDLVSAAGGKEYPLALMMPPQSDMNLKDNMGEWERYKIEMFFLTTSFYQGGQIKQQNKSTGASQQPIQQDWDEMKLCARDFLLQLNLLIDNNTAEDLPLRLVDQEKKLFDPVTMQANDGASGVRLIFKIDVFTGCEIEDYAEGSWETIEIPEF